MKKKLILIISLVISFIIILLISIGIQIGLIGGNGIKIVNAITYTVKNSDMFNQINLYDYTKSGKYHAIININDDKDNNLINLRYDVDDEMKQIIGQKKINILFKTIDASFIAQNENGTTSVKIPALGTKIYKYTSDNDYTSLNEFKLKKIGISEKIQALKAIKKIDFQRVNDRTFNIDSRNVNCKGYSAVLTSDNVKLIESAFIENSGKGVRLENIIKKYFSENSNNIKMTFYIYNKKIAGIELQTTDTNDKLLLSLDNTSEFEKITVFFNEVEIIDINYKCSENKIIFRQIKSNEELNILIAKDENGDKTFKITNINSLLKIAEEMNLIKTENSVQEYLINFIQDTVDKNNININVQFYNGSIIEDINSFN